MHTLCRSAEAYLEAAERHAFEIPSVRSAVPRPIGSVAVIGAGTMGSGIAACLADAELPVALLEQDAPAAAAGAARVEALYAARVRRGRLSPAEAASRLARIRVGEDWAAVSSADLVIEAAFEDLGVKSAIFARLDRLARPGAILATNTSYLDVEAIAAATSRRADVVGLHFFSPAHVMRLIEVVQTAHTATEVLATALALGRRLGKLPILARNGDGFIGNRIFAVYRRHAEYLLEDGASPQEIDAALVAYGFAMGPFAVSDMSGLDIAWAMRRRRAATRDPGERYVTIPDLLCEAGRLGRKAGQGWYDHRDGIAHPSAAVAAIVEAERARRGIQPRHFTASAIQRRLLAVMANEGARVLEEGISLRPSDIDLVFVNGYGFPRAAGGPMHAADEAGLPAILVELEEAAKAGSAGSEPAPLLQRLATQGASFASWAENCSIAPSLVGHDRHCGDPDQAGWQRWRRGPGVSAGASETRASHGRLRGRRKGNQDMSMDEAPGAGPAEVSRIEHCGISAVRRVAAMLDLDPDMCCEGDPLPRGWHFILLGADTRRGALRADGFPGLGVPLPDLGLPRLLLGGRSVTFHGDIAIGSSLRRESRVQSISRKTGANGPMAVVTLEHALFPAGAVAPVLTETQTYILLGQPASLPPADGPGLPWPATHSRRVVPDNTLLFQYSALGFNSHRIHLDRTFARETEGFPDLVVNGGLTTLLLTEMLRTTVGRSPARLRARHLAPLFCDRPVLLTAEQDGSRWLLRAHDDTGRLAVEINAEMV